MKRCYTWITAMAPQYNTYDIPKRSARQIHRFSDNDIMRLLSGGQEIGDGKGFSKRFLYRDIISSLFLTGNEARVLSPLCLA